MNSLAWNENFHSNDKEDCIFYWSVLSQLHVACVRKYNPISVYFPLDVSVNGAFEYAYPIISSLAASKKRAKSNRFACLPDSFWVCVMCEGLKSSLFICRLPAALIISLHSQDKREAIVTVVPETCCHGDCGKVCESDNGSNGQDLMARSGVGLSSRQLDLSLIPAATDGLDRERPSDVSASFIRKKCEVTGRGLCAYADIIAQAKYHTSRSPT